MLLLSITGHRAARIGSAGWEGSRARILLALCSICCLLPCLSLFLSWSRAFWPQGVFIKDFVLSSCGIKLLSLASGPESITQEGCTVLQKGQGLRKRCFWHWHSGVPPPPITAKLASLKHTVFIPKPLAHGHFISVSPVKESTAIFSSRVGSQMNPLRMY